MILATVLSGVLGLMLSLSVIPCTLVQWAWTLGTHTVTCLVVLPLARPSRSFRLPSGNVIPHSTLFLAISSLGGVLFATISSASASPCGSLPGLIVFLVLSPISEELLFRGYLHEQWAGRVPRVAARVASAGLFALLHPHSTISAFILRFALGYTAAAAKDLTGSLWAAILIHSLNNLLALANEGVAFYATRLPLAVAVLVSVPAIPTVFASLVRGDVDKG
ncbi:MAG: CPBP family intramembrane glutamic endopeptidase [Bacillota bacterium]